VPVLHCGDGLPAFPRTNLLLAHFTAAPGPDNHFRVSRDHGAWLYNTSLRRGLLAQPGEDRLPARDFDQLVHPADSADKIGPELQDFIDLACYQAKFWHKRRIKSVDKENLRLNSLIGFA
jgi:hypothetical protein